MVQFLMRIDDAAGVHRSVVRIANLDVVPVIICLPNGLVGSPA